MVYSLKFLVTSTLKGKEEEEESIRMKMYNLSNKTMNLTKAVYRNQYIVTEKQRMANQK